MMGFQAAGAAPIVLDHIVENPETIASAIRIGNPASWKLAITARDESHGAIDSVTDDEIMEPTNAWPARKASSANPPPQPASPVSSRLPLPSDLRGTTCVCVITGAGLKDPDTARTLDWHEIEVPARLDALEAALPIA